MTTQIDDKIVKKINIPVSKLASLIGLNPWEHRYKGLIEYWKKVAPEDFHNVCNNLETSLSIKINQENDLQMLNRLKNEIGLNTIDRLKECRSSDTQGELLRNQRALIREVQNTANLSQDKKAEIAKIIKAETNKSYGTHNEKKAIEYYIQETGLNVDEGQKRFTKVIATSNGLHNLKYEWTLVGKIDGVNSNDEIVEIKNRANQLFKNLRPYERVQLQTYLKMTKKEKGHLVEYLKAKENQEGKIFVISQEFDPQFWKSIHINICKFIEVFHFMLKNDELKKLLLMGDEQKIIEVVDLLFK